MNFEEDNLLLSNSLMIHMIHFLFLCSNQFIPQVKSAKSD